MDVSPRKLPNDQPTCRADGAITGGRFVGISGEPVDAADTGTVGGSTKPRVSHAASQGAGNVVYGVAARDKADTEDVLVWRAGIIPVEVDAAGPIAAGDEVGPTATGTAVVAAGTGRVCVRGAAAGAYALVALDRV